MYRCEMLKIDTVLHVNRDQPSDRTNDSGGLVVVIDSRYCDGGSGR